MIPLDQQGPSPRKLARFWAKVERKGSDDCWPWRGASGKSGHGQFFWDGHLINAQRAAYQLLIGPVAADLCVCHRCDNPPCCNPEHLFLGTKKDNSRDMVAKGRGKMPNVVGEANAAAKLSEADVLAIRATEGKCRDVAALFGVSATTVSSIRSGKTWQHVAADLGC